MQNSSCRMYRLIPAGILMLAITATGCRTSTWKMPTMPSWKMPGSSFFAKREPDAETLAGKGNLPQLPESPAAKYTAESLTAGRTPGAAAPATPGFGSGADLAAKANGYGPTGTSGMGASSPYQTGPYQMAGASGAGANTGLPGSTTPSYGTAGYSQSSGGSYSIAPTSPGASGAANGIGSKMPSPYGGSYGSGTSMPGGSVATTPSTNYPALPNVPGTAMNGSLPGTQPVVPTSYGANGGPGVSNAGGSGAAAPALPAMPPLPTSPSPGNAPAGTGLGTLPSAPPSTAYQGASSPAGNNGSFAPGSTGRGSSYDFSGSGAASATPPASRPSYTLPPNTATQPGGSLIR